MAFVVIKCNLQQANFLKIIVLCLLLIKTRKTLNDNLIAFLTNE